MKENKLLSTHKTAGFTLIELIVALVIGAIIVGAVYSTYIVQQRSYIAQEAVAEMQQNIRAAMLLMGRDIRMAGYEFRPGGANFSFAVDAVNSPTTASRVSVEIDIDEDGTIDSGETITFGFSNANDSNSDGIADIQGATLGRNIGAGFQPIAENIHAIEFRYLDGNGAVIGFNGTTGQVNNPGDIRAVQVSILARANRQDLKFTNTMTYTTASGKNWGPFNDNLRRRFLVTTFQCRNMGL